MNDGLNGAELGRLTYPDTQGRKEAEGPRKSPNERR